MPRQAGLYLRISEDRDDDQLALARQEEDGLALITRRGWTHVDTYRETISAKRGGRRRQFDRLMHDVEAGRITAIVVSEMPRLSRNRRDDLRIVEICQPREVVIAVVRGSDLDMSTAAGRLTADILASAARYEIEQKSERHRRQIVQAAQAGRPHSGPRPFGYRRGGVEPDPVERTIVEEIFRRWLSGARLGEIVGWLHEIGSRTPQGRPWSTESLRVVLRNPRYAGIRGMRPTVNRDTGQAAYWYEEVAPAAWPALVSEAVWRASLAKLRSNMRAAKPGSGGAIARYLLSGIALCGVCESTVIASSSGSTKGRYRTPQPPVRVYKCRATPGHLMRRGDLIDQYVTRVVMDRLTDPDAIDLLLPSGQAADIPALQAEAAAVREEMRQIGLDFADKLISRETLHAHSQRSRQRLDEIEEQISTAGQIDILAPLVHAENIDHAWRVWHDLPLSTQRAIVARLVVVTILRGRPGRPPAGLRFDPQTVRIEPKLRH